MNTIEILEAVKSGKTVFGTLVASRTPITSSYLNECGLDFVFFDTEHTVLNAETLSWMCHTYRGYGLSPIVRIPSPDPIAALQALEGGASGIVVPYIETVEQVQTLRGAVKLSPIKGKLLQDILTGRANLNSEMKQYINNRNRGKLLFLMIESKPAVEKLDELIAVQDLDGIIVGPHDLSCSLGIPECYEHPKFTEALCTILDAAQKKGLISGIHFSNCGPLSLAMDWIQRGINFLIQQADYLYIFKGLQEEIISLRNAKE